MKRILAILPLVVLMSLPCLGALAAVQNETPMEDALPQWEGRIGEPYRFWTIEDKAAFSQLYYAGTNANERFSGVPREGELACGDALAIARQAVMERFGFEPQEIDGWKVEAVFYRDFPGRNGENINCYGFTFWRYTGVPDGGYQPQCSVSLYAESGEVIAAWNSER